MALRRCERWSVNSVPFDINVDNADDMGLAVSIPGGASYLAVDVGTIEVLVLRCLPLGNSAAKPDTIMGPKHAIKAHFVPVLSESSDEEFPSSDDSVSGLDGMVDGASDYLPNRGRKGVDWEAGPSSEKGAAKHKSSTDTQLGLRRRSHSRREKKMRPGDMSNPAGAVDCANDESSRIGIAGCGYQYQ